ncbi:hypothetical protein FJU44_04025 [Acinetobacter baumannii]|nr:hypothetical protein F6W73_07885 [Acinetobacter baumannii]TQF25078.1 hypothetical protein FJU44_04025 [Acinetobacter baumannii]
MVRLCHPAFLNRMYSPSGHYACKAVNEQFRLRFRFPLLRKKPELILIQANFLFFQIKLG